MKFTAAWLILAACATPASACTFAFMPGSHEVPGRIATIKLGLTHAAITSVHTLPVGWQVAFDNDPSWITKATGHAIVGAAFLEASDLSGMISISPEPGYTCSDLAEKGYVTLKLTIYRNDGLHDIVVEQSSLRIAD